MQRIDSHPRGEIERLETSRKQIAQLAAEYDPRTVRMLDLMRERGWTGWNRPERLAEPPGGTRER